MAANPDFRDLFSALNDAEARYLVVGAYAVIHYTEPRYTKDLDLWVEPSPENAVQVLAALQAFGAPTDQLSLADLCDPDLVYQIGVEPNRVDLVMGLGEALTFASAWERSTGTTYDGVPIRLLSLEDLLHAKRAAARPQDLLDASRLEQALRRRDRR